MGFVKTCFGFLPATCRVHLYGQREFRGGKVCPAFQRPPRAFSFAMVPRARADVCIPGVPSPLEGYNLAKCG